MQPITNQISAREKKIYAVLQGVCIFFEVICVVVFVVSDDQTWIRAAFFGMIAFLLVGVIFNCGRRFGIRVLWSKWIRDS